MRVLILAILLAGCVDSSLEQWELENRESIRPEVTSMRVLFIIAQQNFRDEELLEPKAILQEAGHRVNVASISTETATGMLGATIRPDLSVSEAVPDDYDMIVVVGGTGSPELAEHMEVLDLLRAADVKRKSLAAICLGPTILARAGVLNGVRATVYMTEESREIMLEGGAELSEGPVVTDGRFVTANGPKAAREFGDALVALLNKKV